jgi:Rod binding domain-containing protein
METIHGVSRVPMHSGAPLKRAAQELETTFLAHMLQSAGLSEAPSNFGGGAGESQFQTFLVRQQARQLVETGGIGLAEAVFESMKGRYDD